MTQKIITRLFVLIIILITMTLVIAIFSSNKQVYLYVSTEGNDENLGTIEEPFLTIKKAIDFAVAQSEKHSHTAFIINIQEGQYQFNQSLIINQSFFERRNSIVIKGKGNVILSGGITLPISEFSPLTDAIEHLPSSSSPHILQIRLTPFGISEIPEMLDSGFRDNALSPIELFSNGSHMPLARYPNVGYLKATGTTYTSYETNLITSLPQEKLSILQAQTGGRISGFFYHDWSSDTISIDEIFDDGTISSNSQSSYGVRANARYYIDNFISELDSPLEWFIDPLSSTLYIFNDYLIDDVTLSYLSEPLFAN